VFNENKVPYGLSSGLPITISPHVPQSRLPLVLAFEPALLSHSLYLKLDSFVIEPLNAPTTAPCVESTSPVAPSPPTTSNSCVAPNQPASPPATPAPVLSNHHPMITRAKVGIRKPHAFCASNYLLP
jgi:hypothetical protein